MRTPLRIVGLLGLVLLAGLVGGLALAQNRPQQNRPSGQTCPCPAAGGMHGMMGRGGMGGCPMLSKSVADVRVEKTQNGAVIRMEAKDTAQVENLQRMALMAGLCMGADAGAMMPPAGAQPRR